MPLSVVAHLLATQTSTSPVACPHDPWGNFTGWWFCDVLGSFGVDTSKLDSDLIARSLTARPTGGACAGLVGLAGGTCVTLSLWQVTETAAIPLVVAAMAARFLRLVARDDLLAAPGWALADPVLRAIVAIAAISASFQVMVVLHERSLEVAAAAYQAITSAGGSDPVAGVTSGGIVGGIVVLIVQWAYTAVLRLMLLASVLGYQVCIVAAPLFIPLWVYGSDVGLFTWFSRAAGGALVLPLAMGVSWATVVTLTHRSGSGLVGFAMMTAGVWFMGKLVSATSGELFRNHSFSGAMASLFFTESAILNSMRIGGAVMPVAAHHWVARLTAKGGRGQLQGLMQHGERVFTAERGMVSTVLSRLETNSALRRVMAGWIGVERLREHAIIQSRSVRALMRAGNWLGASQLVADFDKANWERGTIGAFNRLPIDQQVKLAYRAVAHGRTGLGRPDDRAEMVGSRALDAAFGPASIAGQDVRYFRGLLQWMNTAKKVPLEVRNTRGQDRMLAGPSRSRSGTGPPMSPTPRPVINDYE